MSLYFLNLDFFHKTYHAVEFIVELRIYIANLFSLVSEQIKLC